MRKSPTGSLNVNVPIATGNTVPSTRSGSAEPDTPNLQPAMSLSSSIASLDPLNIRLSVPNSPAPLQTPLAHSQGQAEGVSGLVERLGMTGLSSVLGVGAGAVGEGKDKDKGKEIKEEDWEEVEIGKGLALYNSTELGMLKGQKRSVLSCFLGYEEA